MSVLRFLFFLEDCLNIYKFRLVFRLASNLDDNMPSRRRSEENQSKSNLSFR